MASITREQLICYLEDSLSTAETTEVERALRSAPELQRQLLQLMHERDRGEHTLGAIWSRHRLSCPSREQLSSYLVQALDPDFEEYIRFHLEQVGCAFCEANLADLRSRNAETRDVVHARRQRLFESSAGLFRAARELK